MSAESTHPNNSKAEARRLFAALRADAHAQQTDAAQRLSAQLTTLQNALPEQFQAGCSIAGFWPYRSEIDCTALLQECRQAGMITALPVTGEDATPLCFREFSGNKQALIAGRFGISEPSDQARLVTPDIILCPLLGCDRHGFRLGYGGGFYDRTIAGLRNAGHRVSVIGLGYDVQLVQSVPVNELDQPLDGLLTPSQFVQFGKG